eukprot:141118-Pleurochrysis_carterae.AAC.2
MRSGRCASRPPPRREAVLAQRDRGRCSAPARHCRGPRMLSELAQACASSAADPSVVHARGGSPPANAESSESEIE